MPSEVKAHARRRTRGVRRHMRFRRGPIGVRLAPPEEQEGSYAFVMPMRPNTIYIDSSRNVTPEETVRMLGHEQVHAVLAQERDTNTDKMSHLLDWWHPSVRSMSLKRGSYVLNNLEPSGLYVPPTRADMTRLRRRIPRWFMEER